MESLLLFDSTKNSPSFNNILIYTCAILISSNLIFLFILSLAGLNINKTIKKEKDKEFKIWKEKNISPWSVLFSEVTNSMIYSPIVEEVFFRIILMKIIFVDQLNIDIWTSNILQSVIFASMHLNNLFNNQSAMYTKMQVFNSFITALVTGFIYVKSNSILPSLFAHILSNSIISIGEIKNYFKYYNQKQN